MKTSVCAETKAVYSKKDKVERIWAVSTTTGQLAKKKRGRFLIRNIIAKFLLLAKEG